MARGGARRWGLARPFRRDVAEALKRSAVHFAEGRQPGHAFGEEGMREIGHAMVRLVRHGVTLAVACEMVGISREAYYRWKRVAEWRDSEKDSAREAYRARCEDVVREVEQALAELENGLLASWLKQAETDWQAARDFLARRFPQRWGNSENRTLQVRQAGQMQLALRWGDEAEAPSVEEESDPGRLIEVMDAGEG